MRAWRLELSTEVSVVYGVNNVYIEKQSGLDELSASTSSICYALASTYGFNTFDIQNLCASPKRMTG